MTIAETIEREVGRHVGARAGASLVVVAGIHGNEPAGVEAARRVFARLGDRAAGRAIDVDGEVVVFAGNVAGLNAGVRYFDRDLNRGWSAARIAAVRAVDVDTLKNEDREQRQLIDAIDGAVARARGDVVLADLHTSSAPGIPFVLFGKTDEQRDFVRAFPIPVISGIVDKVEGVLSEFICGRVPQDTRTRATKTTFSVEGGQHDDAASRDALEAVLWLSMARARMIDPGLVEVTRSHAVLEQMRGDLPKMVDVVSRHAITPDDEFQMERGFMNVARIGKGQLLAHDKRGEVRAEEDGVVVLPLYQKLGNDGFFWGKEVR